MKKNIRQFCTVHADGNDGVIKVCEVRDLDSRAPLAGNDGLTQPLFQTPTHKCRRYSSPSCLKPCPVSVRIKG